MAYPYTREPLDLKRPLYAVRPFVCEGVEIEPGDLFDLTLPPHQVELLWNTRFIDHHQLPRAAPTVQSTGDKPVAATPRAADQSPAAAGSSQNEQLRGKRQGARP